MGSHRWFIWTFIITKWWISYKTRDAKALPFKQANSPFRKLYTSLWCPLSVSRGSKKELLNAIQKNSWPTDFLNFCPILLKLKKPFFTMTWECTWGDTLPHQKKPEYQWLQPYQAIAGEPWCESDGKTGNKPWDFCTFLEHKHTFAQSPRRHLAWLSWILGEQKLLSAADKVSMGQCCLASCGNTHI